MKGLESPANCSYDSGGKTVELSLNSFCDSGRVWHDVRAYVSCREFAGIPKRACALSESRSTGIHPMNDECKVFSSNGSEYIVFYAQCIQKQWQSARRTVLCIGKSSSPVPGDIFLNHFFQIIFFKSSRGLLSKTALQSKKTHEPGWHRGHHVSRWLFRPRQGDSFI